MRPESGELIPNRAKAVRFAVGYEMLKAALTWDIIPSQSGFPLVGVTGFEL